MGSRVTSVGNQVYANGAQVDGYGGKVYGDEEQVYVCVADSVERCTDLGPG